MEKKYCIVTTACNDKENARQITDTLLEKRLVSYVQESKRFSSYYWKGKIVKEDEYFLTMGTKKSLYKEVEKEIKAIHNYEVPAITMYEILDGNEEFFDWLEEETKKE